MDIKGINELIEKTKKLEEERNLYFSAIRNTNLDNPIIKKILEKHNVEKVLVGSDCYSELFELASPINNQLIGLADDLESLTDPETMRYIIAFIPYCFEQYLNWEWCSYFEDESEFNHTRLEFVDDSSNKFWHILWGSESYTVVYGKIGSIGVAKTEECDDVEEKVEKLINSKIKKGYEDVTSEYNEQLIEIYTQKEEVASELCEVYNSSQHGNIRIDNDNLFSYADDFGCLGELLEAIENEEDYKDDDFLENLGLSEEYAQQFSSAMTDIIEMIEGKNN